MGFDLMINFNRPFIYSNNITEFWRRWHISLYTWFTDYLYSPLVIAFREYEKWGIAAAIMITFFFSGLWHGANWAFVIFGLLHGLALVYEIFTRKIRKKISKKVPSFIYQPLSTIITFIVVSIIWIFFRAGNISKAMLVFKSLLGYGHSKHFAWMIEPDFGKNNLLLSAILIPMVILIERYTSADLSELNRNQYFDASFCGFILLLTIIFGVFTKTSFIYFQF